MKDRMKMVLVRAVDSLTSLKVRLEQFSKRAGDRAEQVGRELGFKVGTFAKTNLKRTRRQ